MDAKLNAIISAIEIKQLEALNLTNQEYLTVINGLAAKLYAMGEYYGDAESATSDMMDKYYGDKTLLCKDDLSQDDR